jgi:hypothetical protein
MLSGNYTTNYNYHIYGWLEQIEKTIAKFKERTDVTDEDRIEFITHQYHLVMLIYRALSGKVIFAGSRPTDHQEK